MGGDEEKRGRNKGQKNTCISFSSAKKYRFCLKKSINKNNFRKYSKFFGFFLKICYVYS